MTRDNVWAWTKIIILVLLIRWLWFEPFTIPSGSMEPTLHGDPGFFRGDRVAVDKFSYGPRYPFSQKRMFDLGEPKRWDIVVFNSVASDPEKKILIKRIVGLPGERVHIANGKVYINGQPLELPSSMPPVTYTTGLHVPPNVIAQMHQGVPPADWDQALAQIEQRGMFRYGVLPEEQFSVIPPGHYLMLGDNSGNSLDGRVFGWVPKDNIIGRAFCIWYPFAHWRDLTGFSHRWWGILFLYVIPLTLLAYELLSAFVVSTVRMSEICAGGHIRCGDRIVLNRIAFGLCLPFSRKRLTRGRLPNRNEWLIFEKRRVGNGDAPVLLGRVIGIPGDVVSVTADGIMVNGQRVTTTSRTATAEAMPSSSEAKVLPGHVIVYVETPDSCAVEWVPRENIVGSIVSIWWPLRRRRSFTAQEPM